MRRLSRIALIYFCSIRGALTSSYCVYLVLRLSDEQLVLHGWEPPTAIRPYSTHAGHRTEGELRKSLADWYVDWSQGRERTLNSPADEAVSVRSSA